MVGLSSSHLTTLFRNSTGSGVLAYHTSIKMERARQLLDTSTLSIASIASELGYRDQFYFSRHFKSAHGVSPSAFRQRTNS
ncbi:helix-turn-helix domain-containing protein [Jonesiaceae bacterium BS-20]|uniref:Helix-turn-helix domain-containing protein n=1 Tax=Jonesiaceae bacterium BS-20 TaxID=3120821 RepID=A0AAU7E0T2_9MICO